MTSKTNSIESRCLYLFKKQNVSRPTRTKQVLQFLLKLTSLHEDLHEFLFCQLIIDFFVCIYQQNYHSPFLCWVPLYGKIQAVVHTHNVGWNALITTKLQYKITCLLFHNDLFIVRHKSVGPHGLEDQNTRGSSLIQFAFVKKKTPEMDLGLP